MERRRWLRSAGLSGLGVGIARGGLAAEDPACPVVQEGQLLLQNFRPRSMLHVPQTRVEKPRFPVIDIHTHLTSVTRSEKGVAVGEEVTSLTTPEEALAVMDRKGVRAMLNLTGGIGRGLKDTLAAWDRAYPGRFYTCVQPRFEEKIQAARLMQAGMELLREHRVRNLGPVDLEVDPTNSGMVGLASSPVTTNTGSIEAKRTTTNPNWAAVVVFPEP